MTVSRSSCASKYRAMANTVAKIIQVTHLLYELRALPPDRPTVLCDNQSSIFLSQNRVGLNWAKNIDLDYHFIRELVSSGRLNTCFVPTKLQVVDILTQILPGPQFEFFHAKFRPAPPTIHFCGDNSQNKLLYLFQLYFSHS